MSNASPASAAPPAAAMPTRYRPPHVIVRWVIRLLAAVALGVSGFLFWHAIAAGPDATLPGCAAGSGCEAVLASRWSVWLGIPVAAPAIIMYAILLGAMCQIRGRIDRFVGRQRAAWAVLLLTATVAAGAAVWFIVVQALLVHALCKYCTTVHACGLVIAGLVYAAAPMGRTRLMDDEPRDPMMISPGKAVLLIVFGLLWAGVLVGGQLLVPPASTRVEQLGNAPGLDTGPGPNRAITLLDGRVRLRPHDYPLLGSADAPVLVVELFDYTCPHCRHMAHQLDEARDRFGKQLGVIALPAPLDADCNPAIAHTQSSHEHACELARLGLAVWRAKPAVFADFHQWMFEPDQPRTPRAARREAAKLVGEAALQKALTDPWINQMLGRDAKLFVLGGGSLPQLLTPTAIIHGRPATATELIRMLEQETSLHGPVQSR